MLNKYALIPSCTLDLSNTATWNYGHANVQVCVCSCVMLYCYQKHEISVKVEVAMATGTSKERPVRVKLSSARHQQNCLNPAGTGWSPKNGLIMLNKDCFWAMIALFFIKSGRSWCMWAWKHKSERCFMALWDQRGSRTDPRAVPLKATPACGSAGR